jgi:hypothetical protein
MKLAESGSQRFPVIADGGWLVATMAVDNRRQQHPDGC